MLKVLNENKVVVENQLKNGNAIKLDLLTILSKIDNENNRKIDLETNLKKLINLISYASGIDSVTGNQLNFVLKNYTVEEALQEAVMHNASLAIANDRIASSKAELNMSKLNQMPFVGLKGSMGSKNGYLPAIQDQRFNYNAGIGFSVPLFNGGKIKQVVKIQEKAVSIQQTNAAASLHEVEKDIKAAMIDVQSNEQRIKNAASQIEQAALAQKLSNAKLLNGTATPLEITTTNADYQRALFSQLQFEYQLCIAKLELAKLMGIRLEH
jgi:outer membrane protein TolC